jgi:hypothetical protein
MNTVDQQLLEEAYQRVLDHQIEHLFLDEGFLSDIWGSMTGAVQQTVVQPIKDLYAVGLQDMQAYVAKIGVLAKVVVAYGAGSAVAIYAIGSLLKYLGDKRNEANKLSAEKVLTIATTNTRPQLERLVAAYNAATTDAERKAIIQKQNDMLTQAIKNIDKTMNPEKKSSLVTKLLMTLGGLLQSNSFILGLLLTATLSHFGIITFPSLKL